MNDCLSIGLIFKNEKREQKTFLLKKLFESIQLTDYSILITTSNMDRKTEKDILYIDITDAYYKNIEKYDYNSVLLMCDFFGYKNQMLNIIIYQEHDHFGFVINLYMHPFRKVSDKDIQILSSDYIKDIFTKIKFDYAFYDFEGDILDSIDDLLETDYSVFINVNNELKVKSST